MKGAELPTGGFLLSAEPGEHSSHPIPGRRASLMLFLYSPALLQLKYPPGGRTSTLTRAKTPCRPCTSLPKSWITPALRSRGSSGQAGSPSWPLRVSPRGCPPPWQPHATDATLLPPELPTSPAPSGIAPSQCHDAMGNGAAFLSRSWVSCSLFLFRRHQVQAMD